MAEYTKAQLTELIVGKLRRNFGRDIEDAVRLKMLDEHTPVYNLTLDEIFEIDKEVRMKTRESFLQYK